MTIPNSVPRLSWLLPPYLAVFLIATHKKGGLQLPLKLFDGSLFVYDSRTVQLSQKFSLNYTKISSFLQVRLS